MKAAVLRAFGAPLQIEEADVRAPGQNEILVKVIACGVCHTDLHACNGDWSVKANLPLIPGYEAVGYVVAMGPGVDRIKEGDIVGTRKDMEKAIEFAVEGKVKATMRTRTLENINGVFDEMKGGQIEGRSYWKQQNINN